MHRCSLIALLLAACGQQPGPVRASVHAAVIDAPAGPHALVVFATSSLRLPFEALAARYEQDHPGSEVQLHVDGGAQLLARMGAGETCDVLAIGDSSQMSRFSSAGHLAVGSPTELARSRIAIVVATGNPKQVHRLTDLARPGVRVALGTRSSSIGRYGRWVLSRHPIAVEPTCEATTADGVLARVAAGEADAGIVYVTTLRAAGAGVPGVQGVDVAEEQNSPVLYSISVAREAREPKGAAAFRALALAPTGQGLLRDAGFLPIGAKTP